MKRLALMLSLGLLSAGAFAAVDVDVNIGGRVDRDHDRNIGYFYTSLAPHGEWIQLKDYGYVWQPSVELQDESWRPYANEGHWAYTDDGWYWASDYDWGWAPFHYGRWTYDNQYRWVWAPDTTWGPAWVTWREDDRHFGWAPLPIGAVFEPSVGLSFHGRHVDAGFSFDIGANFWTFVPQDRFLSNNIASVAISSREADPIFRGSRIVNKSYTYNDNRVINNGIPVQTVSRATRQEVKPLHIESQNATAGKAQISGDKIAAYRPQIKNERPANADALIKEAKNRKGEGGAAAQPKADNRTQPENAEFERNRAKQAQEKKEELNTPKREEPSKPAEQPIRTPEAKKPIEKFEENKPAERNEVKKPEAESKREINEVKKPATEPKREINEEARRSEVKQQPARPEANRTPEPRNNPRADDSHRTDLNSTKNDTEVRKEHGEH